MEFKQWWNFRTNQSLWSRFFLAKYCQRSHPILKKWDTGQSQAWKNLTVNRKEAGQYIHWRLHSGEISFRWDNWLGTSPLANQTNGGGKPATPLLLYENLEHKKPVKWSFCLWRALRNKLPTDDRVVSFGQPTVTRCVCCVRPQGESIDHIFSKGHFARIVWKKFSGIAGPHTDDLSLRQLLIKWWLMKANNAVHKLLLDTTPVIICWNHWKNKCGAKYGNMSSSITRVLFAIHSDILPLLKTSYPQIQWPPNWIDIYILAENVKHITTTTQVEWVKPEAQFVKVNCDGSALTNPGKIIAGVIVRDHHSQFIHTITSPFGTGTNNLAETNAATIGVNWCIENGFTRIHLEVDLTILVHWVSNSSKPPWNIQMQLQQLQHLCQQCEEIRCAHTFRKANCPADSLSKLSHDLPRLNHFNSMLDLPSHIRCQIILDQMCTPSFRNSRNANIIGGNPMCGISIFDAHSIGIPPMYQ
ncbi:uncharacterized protein LOC142178023 [Nicotiana tabacum]|uniref:Uncharacterized protein LOC142178023 n=1 Tax=Nicotiana tabacum TaxID=4097 RepID=A0AC58U1T8_TOBAC